MWSDETDLIGSRVAVFLSPCNDRCYEVHSLEYVLLTGLERTASRNDCIAAVFRGSMRTVAFSEHLNDQSFLSQTF